MTKARDSVEHVNVVEFLVMGNELLNGTTLDTNSHWLAKRISRLGGFVSRKTTVRDDPEEIASTLKEIMKRKPNWIFSLGGLGPTFDDMTIRGIAAALGQKVIRDKCALKMLKESYLRRMIKGRRENRRVRLLKSSLKMAEIPYGSTPLMNPVGSAPGVFINLDHTRIFALPGIPSELRAIFAEQIQPILKKDLTATATLETWLKVSGVRESQISPYIETIMRRYSPDVYLKSHPFGFDAKGSSILRFQIMLTSRVGLKSGSSLSLLSSATSELERAISRLGGKILSRKSVRGLGTWT